MRTRAMIGIVLAAWIGWSGSARADDARDVQIRALTATLEMRDRQIEKLKFEVDQLKREVARLKEKLAASAGQPVAGQPGVPVPVPAEPAPAAPAPPDLPARAPTASPVQRPPASPPPAGTDPRPARSPSALPPAKALQKKVAQMAFDRQPFEQVLESFRQEHGLSLWVKWNQLTAAGVKRNAPVTLRLSNVTVGKALQIVLDEVSTSAQIGYAVDDDLVVVALDKDLSSKIETRTYEVIDLVSVQQRAQSSARLIKTITSSIDPKSWRGSGGTGDIREIGGRLIVTTTTRNHEAIAQLLKTLRDQEQR